MTSIEKMTGISITSDFFKDRISLEFFKAKNAQGEEKDCRMALVYGRNGSGKSAKQQRATCLIKIDCAKGEFYEDQKENKGNSRLFFRRTRICLF